MKIQNSVSQLKSWVESQLGEELDGLTKDVISDLLSRDNLPLKVKRVLEIRQQLGKTSVSKYSAMENAMCKMIEFEDCYSFTELTGLVVGLVDLCKFKTYLETT